ncbi:uncharacterized protein EV422DRAFT_477833, partial [Fimicolochytrium jonesii]|uniref:uncharacterized protein n=1 Tax=Fimicolochytrium jonesii TaxID=1396493 RepID=UPI0022FDE83C
DESRLVREEAHRIISTNLLPSLAPYLPTQNGKRQRETTDNRLEMFARQLVEVDMERLRVGCVPEHLYQEVLDVDESVLVEWEDDGVGNNVLACYDC